MSARVGVVRRRTQRDARRRIGAVRWTMIVVWSVGLFVVVLCMSAVLQTTEN